MDTVVSIRSLEATYKSSTDVASLETMIVKLTEKEGPSLKSKGMVGNITRVVVLTWRSLLIMSREWKYYWLRLILYMLLALCICTIFSGLGHTLSSVVIYTCEESNQHSGAFIFLLGQLFASIPFLFLISISSSLVFYFLVGLRDESSMLMYFMLNFFTCLLVNKGLVLAVTSIWQDIFWRILILVSIQLE